MELHVWGEHIPPLELTLDTPLPHLRDEADLQTVMAVEALPKSYRRAAVESAIRDAFVTGVRYGQAEMRRTIAKS